MSLTVLYRLLVKMSVANKPNQKAGRPQKTPKKRSSTHPPALSVTSRLAKHYRFRAANAGAYSIKWSDLGDLLVMAATTTSAYQIADVVTLRAVEIWSVAVDGSINTIDLEYVWSANEVLGNSVIHSDTSLGTATPAHIYAKPPKHSLASFNQSTSNTDVAFKMNVPAGAIIDVHLTFTLRDSTGVQLTQGAVSGATVGTVYARALNSSVSVTTLPVISLLSVS